MHDYNGPLFEAVKREAERRELSPFWQGPTAYIVGAALGVAGLVLMVLALVMASRGGM